MLAGGRSSRMGTDKAMVLCGGTPLIRRVASEVAAAAGSVKIAGRDICSDFRSVPDRYPGFGPVGGVATALEDSCSEWTLIVACDMPGVQCEWLRVLLRRACAQVIIPQTSDGRLHPRR